MTTATHESTPASVARRLKDLALHSPLTVGMWAQPRTFARRAHLDLISAEFRMLTERPGGRLLIMCPPQVGKSQTAATYGPAWYLLRNPDRRIAVATYADALAHHRGRDVRDFIAEHGHRFGVHIARGSASVSDWRTTAKGGLRAVGAGSSLTGIPADMLLIDDPVKDREAADSKLMRNKIWDWWSSVANSRLAPGAPVCVIQTRWHEDDLAGRLLKRQGRTSEGGRWRVVSLPAFAGVADPLGREPGDPLPHPKIRADDLEACADHWHEKRRTSNARDWAALYMCAPSSVEGSVIDAEMLAARTVPFGTPLPERVRVGVAVDPSGGGRDTAGVVGGFLGADDRVYVTHDRSGVMRTEEWSRRACLLAHEIDADFIVVETNYGGDMCGLVINSAWHALSREGRIPRGAQAPYIAEVTARRGKYLRAEPVAQQFMEDRVRLAGHLPELAEEWATWKPTDSESPGRIDASVYLVRRLLPYVDPFAPGEETR